jgi:dihydroorotase
MKALFIHGGRIIDPAQGIDEVGSLVIKEGKVSWMGQGEPSKLPPDCDTLSAQGLVICPGFIDLHCHLREPGFEAKETIATGTRAAARGGFTTICCMPNTKPPLDNRFTIDYVSEKAAAEGVIRVLPVGCVSKGRRGKELAQFDEIASAGVAAFSDDGDPVSNSELMLQALERSRSMGLLIIDHCEAKELTKGGAMNWGVVSARLGLRGMPALAEEIIVARDLALVQLVGGWLHIAHVSTAGSVELIRQAKQKGIRVTAEVTPHHLTLTEEMAITCGTNAKVNPPLRTKKDMEALIEGFKEKVIDVIATDHAPHTVAEKKADFAEAPFGISGFETALGSLMGLVHGGQLDLVTLIAKLASEPARILGDRYGKLGTLAVGAEADVTLLDPDREWIVDTSAFASKGKNTPLAGSALKGKVMATIYQGEIVYKDKAIKLKERLAG